MRSSTGTLGEITYTNKADTYAKMLAITRFRLHQRRPRRIDHGAEEVGQQGHEEVERHLLDRIPRFGRREFLRHRQRQHQHRRRGHDDRRFEGYRSDLYEPDQPGRHAARNGTGDPLGSDRAKAEAKALTDPMSQLITGASSTLNNSNPFRGRFRVESSPYISNNSYTGYTSAGWWMLANPNDMAVIEIAALNGRIEPIVEAADAEFNVLGVQMRLLGCRREAAKSIAAACMPTADRPNRSQS